MTLNAPGFPIRTSPDQSLLSSSPTLIAANHVLHRLLPPRHPPSALSSLTINRAGRLIHWLERHLAVLSRQSRLTFLQARRSQLGKIFSYQRSTDPKIFTPACSGRAHPLGAPLECIAPCSSWKSKTRKKELDLVELDGIAPTTSGVHSPRSPS